MANAMFLRRASRAHILGYLAAIVMIPILTSGVMAQAGKQTPSQLSPEDVKKLSGGFAQFGQLMQKLQSRVQSPVPRTQSRILSVLPESTVVYVALPNWGESSHQALDIFRQEVKDNAELRNWWTQGQMATDGPKIEEAVEKIYRLSEYLGDEVVISAASDGKERPKFVVLAEVRKPGLRDFLRPMLRELAGTSKPSAQVFDEAEFAAAKTLPSEEPIALVGSDVVVLAENLATLRKFNAHLELKGNDFRSTEFGTRLSQEYQGGATIVAGADMQSILHRIPSSTAKNEEAFQRTGFSDMKYLVWRHTRVAGQGLSQMELSFAGPRHGIASWLAAPGPMGSLDFVSPKCMMAMSLRLKNPAQIFDDIQDLAATSNPNASASMSQMGAVFGVNLRDDIFGHLTGEITLEAENLTPQNPAWRVVAKTTNPSALLSAIRKILVATNNMPVEFEQDGVTFHTIVIRSPQKTLEIAYAVSDGYLIVASGREELATAVRLHHSGESLAKSSRFQASLPNGKLADISALLYEDPLAMAAITLRQASPELAQLLGRSTVETAPVVITGYGDTMAIRAASRTGQADTTVALVAAAVAIPNLLRARIAANESSAVASVRTLNTGQITYASSYPARGFARDLASLGPGLESPPSQPSPQHASLIDSSLAGDSCTSGAWCTKSGYRFTITATCRQQRCRDYVVVGTPVSASTGTRNFCSTSDAVVRFQTGAPLDSPVSAAECRHWTPLQ